MRSVRDVWPPKLFDILKILLTLTILRLTSVILRRIVLTSTDGNVYSVLLYNILQLCKLLHRVNKPFMNQGLVVSKSDAV